MAANTFLFFKKLKKSSKFIMAALLIKTNTDPSFINLNLEELIIDSLEEVMEANT